MVREISIRIARELCLLALITLPVIVAGAIEMSVQGERWPGNLIGAVIWATITFAVSGFLALPVYYLCRYFARARVEWSNWDLLCALSGWGMWLLLTFGAPDRKGISNLLADMPIAAFGGPAATVARVLLGRRISKQVAVGVTFILGAATAAVAWLVVPNLGE